MAVTFGCSLPSSGAMSSPESLRSLAQRAEDLGFDSRVGQRPRCCAPADRVVLPLCSRRSANF